MSNQAMEPPRTERLNERQEVLRVLDRAYQDQTFWKELMGNGSALLEEVRLSSAAKAAIMSGDLNWLRENVGELSAEQLLFVNKRLERESW